MHKVDKKVLINHKPVEESHEVMLLTRATIMTDIKILQRKVNLMSYRQVTTEFIEIIGFLSSATAGRWRTACDTRTID